MWVGSDYIPWAPAHDDAPYADVPYRFPMNGPAALLPPVGEKPPFAASNRKGMKRRDKQCKTVGPRCLADVLLPPGLRPYTFSHAPYDGHGDKLHVAVDISAAVASTTAEAKHYNLQSLDHVFRTTVPLIANNKTTLEYRVLWYERQDYGMTDATGIHRGVTLQRLAYRAADVKLGGVNDSMHPAALADFLLRVTDGLRIEAVSLFTRGHGLCCVWLQHDGQNDVVAQFIERIDGCVWMGPDCALVCPKRHGLEAAVLQGRLQGHMTRNGNRVAYPRHVMTAVVWRSNTTSQATSSRASSA